MYNNLLLHRLDKDICLFVEISNTSTLLNYFYKSLVQLDISMKIFHHVYF